MAEYKIYGGTRLTGRVRISGAKNGALPLLFASILAEGECVFYHMPDIGDVRMAAELLARMGARVTWRDPHTVSINTAGVMPEGVPTGLSSGMRASSYLLGACLSRFGYASAPRTGGCDFGNRPLNCHYEVFHAMGAVGEEALCAPHGLHGCSYVFPQVSVGATVNALLAASRTEGTTELWGCATEPHVVALQRFLTCLGVRITGLGGRHLTVVGNRHLRGCAFSVAPDEIEAGTYLCAAAACGGTVTVADVAPAALAPLLAVLEGAGCEIERAGDAVTLTRTGRLRGAEVETAPAPGFPTDLHPPLAAALCMAEEVSHIRERVWQERFRYTGELMKMGADMRAAGDTLTVRPATLHPASVTATDLRGGAALVIAALATGGRSVVAQRELLERGYERLPQKLRGLGAEIL
jgi:UDP-N-acetylglucosamine 1-carboxyvinyltransferase